MANKRIKAGFKPSVLREIRDIAENTGYSYSAIAVEVVNMGLIAMKAALRPVAPVAPVTHQQVEEGTEV